MSGSSPDETRRPEHPGAWHEGDLGHQHDLRIHLADLCCRSRGRGAEAVLRGVPGVTAASVSFHDELADVRLDVRRTSVWELTTALTRAGYRVAPAPRRALGAARGPLFAVALAAMVSALLLAAMDAGRVTPLGATMEIAAAAIGVVAAGLALGRRAGALARRGILDRDALALAGGAIAIGLGVRQVAGTGAETGIRAVLGSGFAAAAAIATAAIAVRLAEDALRRRAGRDPSNVADTEAPVPETWEDAVVRGVLTAVIGCASFALVTHACTGEPPFGARALSAAIAVLVVAAPSPMLVATPAAEAFAVLRARAAGARVIDAGALVELSAAGVICVEKRGPEGDRAAIAYDTGARGRGARMVIGDARALPEIVGLGRALSRTTRANAALVIGYHAILVPAAAVGWVPPIAAAGLSLIAALAGLGAARRLAPRA